MKLVLSTLVLMTSSLFAASPLVSGGDEGIDILPIAAADLVQNTNLILTAHADLLVGTDAELAQLTEDVECRVKVLDDSAEYEAFGTADSVADLLEWSSAYFSGSSGLSVPSPSLDAHPKQPTASSDMKKDWKDGQGKSHTRYITVLTERRTGEIDEEWVARHERNVEAFERKGYESIP